jgi:Protein of unknown function (DUF1579)
MESPKPTPEHQWLHRLMGDWTFEGECNMGPDQPTIHSSGKESVRSLGGLWTIGEGEGEMPDGGLCKTIMTLGYDPEAKQFVGTFIASVMTYLWTYRGTLNATGNVLTLDTEGPSFAGDGTMSKYQDIIEFIDDNHRTLASQLLGPDGKWVQFMKSHYHRVS